MLSMMYDPRDAFSSCMWSTNGSIDAFLLESPSETEYLFGAYAPDAAAATETATYLQHRLFTRAQHLGVLDNWIARCHFVTEPVQGLGWVPHLLNNWTSPLNQVRITAAGAQLYFCPTSSGCQHGYGILWCSSQSACVLHVGCALQGTHGWRAGSILSMHGCPGQRMQMRLSWTEKMVARAFPPPSRCGTCNLLRPSLASKPSNMNSCSLFDSRAKWCLSRTTRPAQYARTLTLFRVRRTCPPQRCCSALARDNHGST